MENTLSLIGRIAASQDADATEDLLRIIQRHHMDRETRRFRGRNVLVDDDDIASHFLEGCYVALSKVRPDVGNPLLYVLWRGKMAVATLFRDRLRQGVQTECQGCGQRASLRQQGGRARCRKCGSTDVRTWMVEEAAPDVREIGMEPALFEDVGMECDLWFSRATYRVQIEELRARLTGRVRELFDLLVVEGINAQTCQNYLREIGQRWGVSSTCVAVYLRRLRAEALRYFEDA